MKNKIACINLVLYLFICLQASKAQYTLTGNTFSERSESLINCMVNEISPYSGNVNIKYTSAFYWARIYKGVDAERAEDQLKSMYAEVLGSSTPVSGSDIEFFAHMSMHGYLLCKEKISAELKQQIKDYLHTVDFNSIGSTSTLNLDLQKYTAGLLAAQEWPDFTDKNNKNATQITAYNRSRILTMLDLTYHNNCKEMDAFIYLPTDMMCVRMLAEFSTDAEIRQRAYVVYQQVIASMVGAWNQGVYVANPPRAKGWGQLVAGPYGSNSRIGALAWLFFGNPLNQLKMTNQYVSDTDNYPCFCFWLAYTRNIYPMQAILDAESRKSFPYEYKSMIDDQVVNKNNGITKNWKYYKYTYQSQNYGLATQTEIPYNLSGAVSTYCYKEIKRTYLAWQSDDSDQCFFSVCQDNPERPTDAVNHNGVAYGENPYHRVLQYKSAAVGITNVPSGYLGGNFYQMYVPFSRLGIKLKKVSDNWVFCHTGTMMFAFRTIEPFTMMTRSPYNVPNCDILMFTDMTTRKGSWILQTTEITEDLKGADMDEELNKFKAKLLSNSIIETLNYEGNAPQVRYTSMDGDVIDITYFAPTQAYADQYKVNGVVQNMEEGKLLHSPFVKQTHKSDDVYIYNSGDTPVILNWNDQVPTSGINLIHSNKHTISGQFSGSSFNLYNIPVEQDIIEVAVFNKMGEKVKQDTVEVNNNQCAVNVGTLMSDLYFVQLISPTNQWVIKAIKW